MGVNRISSNYIVDRGVYNIQNNLSLMARLQEQVASGRNISNPSDNPVGLTQLLRINLELNQDDRFGKNVDEGLSELGAAEVAMTGIVDVAHRANELAIQAANGTNTSQQLSAMSKEVDTLIDQLVQLGNTSFAGRYIFSGLETDQAAFSVTGQDITYDGTPQTDAWQREIQVAKNSFTPINFNGEALLGSVTVAGGVPTGSGLIYNLTKLKLDIDTAITDMTGGVPPDFDAIRANIDEIKDSQQGVLVMQAQLGGRFNQLELIRNRIEDRHIIQAQEIAKIQEVDMPEAISNLNFQQNIYQASIAVLTKILQTSLVNFLR